jgi:hypothetical protein
MMTMSPGREDVADVGLEPVTVDRPVQHHRRDHAGQAQTGDQRRGLAVVVLRGRVADLVEILLRRSPSMGIQA